MKIKYLLLLSLSAMLLASCGKDPDDPEPTPQVVRYSILGDSYCTYPGYVQPDTNTVWPSWENIRVTDVEKTWWKQVENTMGWTLERNNSYSGSFVCNYWVSPPSFLDRMNNLGNPDVILVFGATNDTWNTATLDEYVYEDWTDEQLHHFRPALAKLFYTLKQSHPEAKIYFMLDMSLGEGYTVPTEVCATYRESITVIADHYEIPLIKLYNIRKDWGHPDDVGMKSIADQVVAALKADKF